jgi:hypothetical protein
MSRREADSEGASRGTAAGGAGGAGRTQRALASEERTEARRFEGRGISIERGGEQ